MDDLDWGQHASLLRAVGKSGPVGGPMAFEFTEVAAGTLLAMVRQVADAHPRDRQRFRLVIAGGFHLDGGEIEALFKQG